MLRLRVCLLFLILMPLLLDTKEIFTVEKVRRKSPLDKDTLASSKASARKAAIRKKLGHKQMLMRTEALTVKGVEIPDCARGCTDHFFKTLEVAFRSGNNFERFSNACPRFNETVVCLNHLTHCTSPELFNTMTSGVRYMCIEQHGAFKAVIECIDANAAEIKDVCAKSCNMEGIVTGWAVYAALRGTSLFSPQIGSVPSKVNVPYFRKMVGEGCGVMECYLGCLRTKYNNRCYGVAGSLLSEVLVRPVADGHDSMLITPFTNIFKLALPDDCNVFTSKSGLDHYRIEKKLDEDLRRTYAANRTTEFKYILPNGTFVSHEKPNPFTKSIAENRHSPLEDGKFDRDILWRTAMTGRRGRGRPIKKREVIEESEEEAIMSMFSNVVKAIQYFL